MKSKAVEKQKPRRSGSSKVEGGRRKAVKGEPGDTGKVTQVQEESTMYQPLMREIHSMMQMDDVRRTLFLHTVKAVASALQNASTMSLQEALEAPTYVGSAAHLLSLMVGSNEAVQTLDPLTPAILRGAAMKRDILERAGPILTTADVAKHLRISRQAVAKRVHRGALLAIPNASGELMFPAIQFTDMDVVKGLKEVLEAFNVESPWTRLAVLLDTDDSLDGARVIDALRAGNLPDVLRVIRSFGA